MNELISLGFSPFFHSEFFQFGYQSHQIGRIAQTSPSLQLVLLADQSSLWLPCHPQLTQAQDRPLTVGDFVALDPTGQRIDHLFEPKNLLTRVKNQSAKSLGDAGKLQPLAANLDWGLIVTACGGEYNPRRLERYLALCHSCGLDPVILLNKLDLVPDGSPILTEIQRLAPLAPCLALSLETDPEKALASLEPYLSPAATLVLLGSSGVGKSSLANLLTGQNRQATSAVQEESHKGRHTTSDRRLLALKSGAWLIDGPGLRELQPWMPLAQVEELFADLAELEESCRFSNCRHQGEPGCQVQEALDHQTLDPGRWQNFQKLKQEARLQQTRREPELLRQHKQAQKKLHQSYRQIAKAKKKRKEAGMD